MYSGVTLCVLLSMLVLAVCGQNCKLASVCAVGNLNVIKSSSLLDLTLVCPYEKDVSRIVWWYSQNGTGGLNELDTNSKFLLLRNLSSRNEGAYHCDVYYTDHSVSYYDLYCVYVRGRPYFSSCPDSAECNEVTVLKASEGDSIEFDSRMDYRNGGPCAYKEQIRLFTLKQLQGEGSDSIFTCSNLGRNVNKPVCPNKSRVSVSFQGRHKFDIKLAFHDLALTDAGNYKIEVEVILASGDRITVNKDFYLDVIVEPTTTVTLPPTTTMIPSTSTPTTAACSHDTPSVMLLLNGEILANDSNVLYESIATSTEALFCVTTDIDCCEASDGGTGFRDPNGTFVGETPDASGLYLTRGKHIIRLNNGGKTLLDEGKYCCTTPHVDDNLCVNITNML